MLLLNLLTVSKKSPKITQTFTNQFVEIGGQRIMFVHYVN